MGEHREVPAETGQTTGQTTEVTVTGKFTVDGSLAPWSARTDAVVRWIGGHLGELAVVGGTAVAGLVSHPTWWAVTVPAAAGWFAHERALRRRRASVMAAEAARTRHVASAGGDDASPAGRMRPDVTTDNNDGEVRRGLA